MGTYSGAERYPFQSPTKPGLSVSGSGRGCNQLTGRFVVLELVLSPLGEVEHLAIDFEQHCEGGPAALIGSIRFHSDVVPTILDRDADGWIDIADNCPTRSNVDQANADGDEFGDVCDPYPSTSDNLGACLAGIDFDGDGELNDSDWCSGTETGESVDPGGCSKRQFCAGIDATTKEGRLACRRADWRNDEPAALHPRDCFLYRKGGVSLCVAAPE